MVPPLKTRQLAFDYLESRVLPSVAAVPGVAAVGVSTPSATSSHNGAAGAVTSALSSLSATPASAAGSLRTVSGSLLTVTSAATASAIGTVFPGPTGAEGSTGVFAEGTTTGADEGPTADTEVGTTGTLTMGDGIILGMSDFPSSVPGALGATDSDIGPLGTPGPMIGPLGVVTANMPILAVQPTGYAAQTPLIGSILPPTTGVDFTGAGMTGMRGVPTPGA